MGARIFCNLFFLFNIYSVLVETLRIYFDFVELHREIDVIYNRVDMRTIVFHTPQCLLAPSDQNQTVPIIAIQDNKIIGKFNFVYLSRKYTATGLT
jgi:hypothetical protein